VTKTIASPFAMRAAQDYITGQPIASERVQAIAHANHRLFAVAGSRIPGLVLDPTWTTTSSTFTTPSSSAGALDLKQWRAATRLERDAGASGALVGLTLRIFGSRVSARLSVRAVDTSSLLFAVTATQATVGFAWAEQTVTFGSTGAHVGGSTANERRLLDMTIAALATSGTGTLVAFDAIEWRLVSGSDLPRL